MNIEEEIFKRTKIDYTKLLDYGFKVENNLYKYSKNIMDKSFRVDIEITKTGTVKGKIYDLLFNDEYTNFRLKNINGSFVSQVKEEFINILTDIKNNCTIEETFIYAQSNRINSLIYQKYKDTPQFKWKSAPGYAVFQNENKKWYAIIMNISQSKLDNKTDKEIEILNIKLETSEIKKLLTQKGFYPAYHMNKNNWITLVLDDAFDDTKIMDLIAKSHNLTC